MNILRISTRIYPDVGGPAKQVRILSEFLSNNNFSSFNITCLPKNKYNIKKEKINNNFIIYYLPLHAPGINLSVFRYLGFFIKYLIYGLFKSIKIHRKYRVDIIHAHTPPPTGFIAYIMSKIFRIPYFYTIHGLDYPLFNLDIKTVVKNSKKTFTITRKIENYLKYNFKLNNINWFYNGIETSKYFHINTIEQKEHIIEQLKLNSIIKRNDFIIIYIGYMIFQQKVKGMIDFLHGFNLFLKDLDENERRRIKLLYIGEGKYSSNLERKISEFNLKNNTFILGKRKEIKEILAITDLLALTSYIEGFPNVILEAMASKVPCLGTNVGEIKFIIGETGYIVEPGDIKNIKNILQKYINSLNLNQYELMNKALFRVRKLFDIKIIGKKLLNEYIKLKMNV